MLIFVYFAILGLSVPAALTFLMLFGVSRRRACLVAGILWLLPIPYEVLIQVNCTGECNIRIDLLVVLPLEVFGLWAVSTKAVWSFMSYRRGKRTGDERHGGSTDS